jgi:alkylhydroperoxidase family enzyme
VLRPLCAIAIVIAFTSAAAQEAAAPSPVEVWHLRQQADSLAGTNPRGAEPLYQRLLAADSSDAQLWLALAGVETALHQSREARRALVHVFAGGYGRGQTAVQIARLAAADGDRGQALAWLDSAVAYRVASRASFKRDSAFAALHTDPRFARIAGMLPSRPFTRVAGWRYDIAFFASEARRLHTGFARNAFSPEFTDATAALDRRVPTLTDEQIIAGLQRLATLLGDGHSGVYRRTLLKGHTRLPVDFYAFSDGLYIIGARDDHRDLTGSRVVRIGRLTAADAITALAPWVPRDNPMRIVGMGVPYYLAYPFQLQAIGATDSIRSISLTLEKNGQTREVTLPGDDTRLPVVRLLTPAGADSTPLWLQHVTTNYWTAPLPELHALYFQYNAVADMPAEPVAQFSERLRRALKEPGVQHLIVDVRRNGGGNSFLNLPLHLAIIEFEQASPQHRVWVLAGRHTFSAAQNFVNYLERFTGAVFVGEPTGSRPNFTGENGEVILPYSGVVAEISNENHFSAFWEDQRAWVAPTVPVAVTARDYFANHDAALDAVKAIIRSIQG